MSGDSGGGVGLGGSVGGGVGGGGEGDAEGAKGGGGAGAGGGGGARGVEDGLKDALPLILEALAHMQEALRTLEASIERTDGLVREVDGRVQALEDKVEKLRLAPQITEERGTGDYTVTQTESPGRLAIIREEGDVGVAPSSPPLPPPPPPPAPLSAASEEAASSPGSVSASATLSASASSCSLRARRARPRHAALRGPTPPPAETVAEAALRRTRLGRELLRAAQDGRLSDVRSLLDAGADPNFARGSDWRPIHRAARVGCHDVVTLLLSRGANVNSKTHFGFTALHIASYNDHTGRCTSVLLEAGGDVHARTQSGRTPLHAAAECGNVLAVLSLLAAGASRADTNDDGKTPYQLAKTNCIRRLLSR